MPASSPFRLTSFLTCVLALMMGITAANAQTPPAVPATATKPPSPPAVAISSAPLQNEQFLRLWPGAAPLAQGDDPVIDIPTLQVFLPAAGQATCSAMVIFPGGGYQHLSDHEGHDIGVWLASHGITSFVVKYRLGLKYHYPAEFDDAQRAIRDVRAHAADWKLDSARIGIIGFSAGGHLASTLATHFTPGDAGNADPVEHVSSRPDLHILLYPVITLTDEPNVHKGSRTYLLGDNPAPELMELLSNEKQVTKDTPPAFVVHSTADKTVPVANSDAYVEALMKNNVPVTYLRGNFGGHGFGLTDDWNAQCIAWLRAHKF